MQGWVTLFKLSNERKDNAFIRKKIPTRLGMPSVVEQCLGPCKESKLFSRRWGQGDREPTGLVRPPPFIEGMG